jgi:hypothetical protein
MDAIVCLLRVVVAGFESDAFRVVGPLRVVGGGAVGPALRAIAVGTAPTVEGACGGYTIGW